MNTTPELTVSPQADPRVNLGLTIALSGTAVVLACLGYIGRQEGWWDALVAYVFYATAAMDALLSIFLPRFISGQTRNIRYNFYDDRLEIGDGNRVFMTISYAHFHSIREDHSEKQKYAGRSNLRIEVDKAAMNNRGATGKGTKTLNILNISSRDNPAERIRDLLERYERDNL